MRRVYLTIDDGPSQRIEELLNYLTNKHFGAILFCCGNNMHIRSESIIRAICNGFIIGNHSYNHADFNKLSKSEVKEQIEKTDILIEELYTRAGIKRCAKYFRFPYGHTGATEKARIVNQEILHEFGYYSPLHASDHAWAWDVSVEDWHISNPILFPKQIWVKVFYTSALKRLQALRNESVLLLHDHEASLRLGLFQRICDAVIASGFSFHDNEYLREQARRFLLTGRQLQNNNLPFRK